MLYLVAEEPSYTLLTRLACRDTPRRGQGHWMPTPLAYERSSAIQSALVSRDTKLASHMNIYLTECVVGHFCLPAPSCRLQTIPFCFTTHCLVYVPSPSLPFTQNTVYMLTRNRPAVRVVTGCLMMILICLQSV